MSGDGVRSRGGWPVRLGDVLGEALERTGARGAWTEASVRKVWPKVVGDEVAARAWVGRLRGTTLEVRTADESWATQLRYLAGGITERLNEALGAGTVTEIEVRRARGRRG